MHETNSSFSITGITVLPGGKFATVDWSRSLQPEPKGLDRLAGWEAPLGILGGAVLLAVWWALRQKVIPRAWVRYWALAFLVAASSVEQVSAATWGAVSNNLAVAVHAWLTNEDPDTGNSLSHTEDFLIAPHSWAWVGGNDFTANGDHSFLTWDLSSGSDNNWVVQSGPDANLFFAKVGENLAHFDVSETAPAWVTGSPPEDADAWSVLVSGVLAAFYLGAAVTIVAGVFWIGRTFLRRAVYG